MFAMKYAKYAFTAGMAALLFASLAAVALQSAAAQPSARTSGAGGLATIKLHVEEAQKANAAGDTKGALMHAIAAIQAIQDVLGGNATSSMGNTTIGMNSTSMR